MSDSICVRLKRLVSRRLVSVTAASLVVLAVSGEAKSDETPADVFPGVYKLTVTPNSAALLEGRQTFAEYVQFESGNFTAESCAKLGFTPTAYAVKTVDGKTVFEVTLTSGQQGSQVWTGRRGATSLTGTLTWTKSDGDVYVYTFSGQSTDVPTEPEADPAN